MVPMASNDAALCLMPAKVGALKTTDINCGGSVFQHADRGRRGMTEQVLEVSDAAKKATFPPSLPNLSLDTRAIPVRTKAYLITRISSLSWYNRLIRG